MTGQEPKRKISKATRVATLALAGAAVAVPLLIDASDRDLAFHSAVVVAATRDGYALTFPVALPLMPNVMIESGTLSVASESGSSRSTGAAVLALLSGGKARLELNDAVLSIAPTQSSNPIADKKDGSIAPILASLLKLSFSQLDLQNSKVRLGRSAGADATLSNVNFNVTIPRANEAHATGSFEHRGQTVSFDIFMTTAAELQNGQAQGKATIGRNLALKMQSDLFSLDAKGTLSAGDQPQFVAANSKVTVSNIPLMAEWVGLAAADIPGPTSFEATGPLEFTPQAISFADAQFKIDGNSATGALALKLSGEKPSLDGTLGFTTLDIAEYFKPQTANVDASPAFDVSRYLPRPSGERPFPLLDKLDADLRISAAKVSFAERAFGKGAASLSIKDGMLLADLAELEFGQGGRCTGQLAIHMTGNQPRYTLRGKTEAIDLGQISRALFSYDVLSGGGDMTIDIAASGEDRPQLISGMQGKVSLVQPSAGQLGLDLKTLAATARAQTQAGWGGAARGQTAIEGLQANFSLADGQMTIERMTARAGDANLSGEGGVHFPDRIGDLKIWITHPRVDTAPADVEPASHAGAAPTAAPASASEAKTSGGGLHIQGSFDNPEIRFLPLSDRKPEKFDGRQPKSPLNASGKG